MHSTVFPLSIYLNNLQGFLPTKNLAEDEDGDGPFLDLLTKLNKSFHLLWFKLSYLQTVAQTRQFPWFLKAIKLQASVTENIILDH